MAAIKEGSKEGLRELRATLGMLRQVDEEAPTAPTPGLAGLDDLIVSATRAGLDVRVDERGAGPSPPAAVDLAAYRIVQESLTNAARHSGARHVTIRIHRDDRQLTIGIEDDGRGSAPAGNAGGTGIAGMTERARALGGMLSARPGPAGGFVVRARLPFTVPDKPMDDWGADDQDPAGG
ncbi:ATP-binding protein [Frankia sp. CcI49]|uniref:sensor histidine kinase n=1 Tax=Frankia sp. CcI49 TaxID=1745382 RepID=UPI0018E94AB9|nr:ATP-binding protein [Frankia sp. CcI49]